MTDTAAAALVHASARVDPRAELGPGVRIGARTSVAAGARLGDRVAAGVDCTIGRDALIEAGVVLGDRVVVHDRALVYAGVVAEDGAYVGPGAILAGVRTPRGETPDGAPIRPGDAPVEPIHLGRGATVGAAAVVLGGCAIGAAAMVAAGAVATHDVPANALVAGDPARRIGWVCVCGARLLGADGEPAPAEPPHYALHPELGCPRCGRVYVHAHGRVGIEERTGPTR